MEVIVRRELAGQPMVGLHGVDAEAVVAGLVLAAGVDPGEAARRRLAGRLTGLDDHHLGAGLGQSIGHVRADHSGADDQNLHPSPRAGPRRRRGRGRRYRRGEGRRGRRRDSANGGAAIALGGDLAEEQTARMSCDSTVAEFGRVDVLHNNAALTASELLVPGYHGVRGVAGCLAAVLGSQPRKSAADVQVRRFPKCEGTAAVRSSTCRRERRCQVTGPAWPTVCRSPGCTP